MAEERFPPANKEGASDALRMIDIVAAFLSANHPNQPSIHAALQTARNFVNSAGHRLPGREKPTDRGSS